MRKYSVSNYYFSKKPLLETDDFHVTSFRGRPENKLTDFKTIDKKNNALNDVCKGLRLNFIN